MSFPGNLRLCFKCLPGLLLAAFCQAAQAWGPQGHRIAGTLMEPYLSPASYNAMRALIGDESLGDASTWADRMRDSPSPFWRDTAGPYHYVTVPPGKTYIEVGAPRKGDSVTALASFRQTLLDPAASRVHKQLALRFALHIIQDLHQPMHVGNGRDRGGNDVRLKLNGKSTNLHRVWDSAILAVAGRSDGEWVARLAVITPQQAADWAEPDPLAWVAESAALRDRVYPTRRTISEHYLQQWLPSVELRLQKSAVRSATWLNAVFEAASTLPNP
jgi:hypothetical protein